jgi:type IX secretion system PorP/SprF family membrane protein
MKYYMPDYDKGFWGFGGIINYDQAGDGKYNLTDINALGSYTFKLNSSNLITLGALVGYASEGFTSGNFTWDSQWNGDAFDETIGSGEPFADRERLGYFETGIGLNYRWQKDQRTKLDLGVGAFHLLSPNTSFTNDGAELPIRLDIGGVASFKVANPFDIQLHVNYKTQQVHDELMLGALVNIYVNQNRGKELNLHLGSSYRTSGFLMPTIAIQYQAYYVGFSYDVNLTPFRSENNIWQGGPELHFRYIITKVKALSQFKACPIF